MYDNLTANIILDGENLKAFPPKSGTTRVTTLTVIIQYSFVSHSQSNQTRNTNNNPDLKKQKEVKLSLFADDLFLYIENHKETTRELQELINEFSKAQDT